MSQEIKEEYDRFKAEYPFVYTRLLEINRALGALQRHATKQNKLQHGDRLTEGQVENMFVTTGDNNSPFLELE